MVLPFSFPKIGNPLRTLQECITTLTRSKFLDLELKAFQFIVCQVSGDVLALSMHKFIQSLQQSLHKVDSITIPTLEEETKA